MRSFIHLLTLSLSAIAAVAAPTPLRAGELEARQACPDVQVFFARGTGEIGTLGTVVGPRFSAALNRELSGQSVSFTGIDYAASVAGFLAGGDARGARTMADSVTSTANSCPNTKIVISGYSQGAQVTHKAAGQLPAAIQDRIAAVVTFGDPNERTALPGVLEGRRKTFCNTGDLICRGQSIILAPHLAYGSDTPAAAAFVGDSV